MAKKGQGKRKSEDAEQVVLRLARELIDAIPGDTWTYTHNEVYGRIGLEPNSVLKSRVLFVFEWMIRQTNGFTTPFWFNFQHGEAPIIGLCLCCALHSALSNKLCALNKTGVRMPTFSAGWHGGPDKPYVWFSDLSHDWTEPELSRKMMIINIHGRAKFPEQTVLLEKILF